MAYQSTFDDPGRDTNAFYRRTLHVLSDARVPFLVGGSHALLNYTGIVRETKDFDLFLRRADSTPRSTRCARPATTPRSRSRTGSRRRSKGTTSSISCSARATASAASTTSGSTSRSKPTCSACRSRSRRSKSCSGRKRSSWSASDTTAPTSRTSFGRCAETLDWDRVVRRFDPLLAAAARRTSCSSGSSIRRSDTASRESVVNDADRSASQIEISGAAERGARLSRNAHCRARSTCSTSAATATRTRASRRAATCPPRMPCTGPGRSSTFAETNESSLTGR